jgi:hypothetical protein
VKQKYIRTASLSCRIVSAQKDLDQAAVVPGSYKEIEERVDDDSKKCRRVSIFQFGISKSFIVSSTEWICNLFPQHNIWFVSYSICEGRIC